MSTISPQDQMSVYDVAALTLGELANIINDVRVEFEQVQAAAAEAEARLASQQVELTDWILVADGVKHDWRCCHGEAGTDLCLRCQLEKVQGEAAGMAGNEETYIQRLASQGEQIAQLTHERDKATARAVMSERFRAEDAASHLDDQAVLFARMKAALTARDEAERRQTETLEALNWITHVVCGVSKDSSRAGQGVSQDEWVEAIAHAQKVLAPALLLDPSADPPKEQG